MTELHNGTVGARHSDEIIDRFIAEVGFDRMWSAFERFTKPNNNKIGVNGAANDNMHDAVNGNGHADQMIGI